MNYSNVTKPAKILNLSSLEEVSENLNLIRTNDTLFIINLIKF